MCQACEPYRQTVVTTASRLRGASSCAAPPRGASDVAMAPAPTPPRKPRLVCMNQFSGKVVRDSVEIRPSNRSDRDVVIPGAGIETELDMIHAEVGPGRRFERAGGDLNDDQRNTNTFA